MTDFSNHDLAIRCFEIARQTKVQGDQGKDDVFRLAYKIYLFSVNPYEFIKKLNRDRDAD